MGSAPGEANDFAICCRIVPSFFVPIITTPPTGLLKLAVCGLGSLAAVEQLGSSLGEQRDAVGVSVTDHRAKKRRQNLLTRLRYTCNSHRYPRVACQDLMAALVGDHRFEGKILRVGIPLERFGIDGEQIVFGRVAPAVLRAA